MDQERARNQLESEKREARLKAEKEALSKACQQEAAELGNAWAVVEAAAGFNPGDEQGPEGQGAGNGMTTQNGHDGAAGNGSGSPSSAADNKMHHLAATAGAGGGGGGGGENGLLPGIVGSDGAGK